ncbi:hypothetical protein EV421DRAFT_1503372 [Armillaria borealis]|uniref:Uncharacterized protein n=1 Tax=Armillaria borealis TaxID=47425 RepID=A0AA39IYV9_9AGAR|nr:hypothetical protein EV421DRAFT_1503372 [Armillaria borealis]
MYRTWAGYWYRSNSSVHSLDSSFHFNDLTIPSRLFAKEGCAHSPYCRPSQSDLRRAGRRAATFAITYYNTTDINTSYAQICAQYQCQLSALPAHDVRNPFHDTTPEAIQAVTQANIEGAFAFSKTVILGIPSQRSRQS